MANDDQSPADGPVPDPERKATPGQAPQQGGSPNDGASARAISPDDGQAPQHASETPNAAPAQAPLNGAPTPELPRPESPTINSVIEGDSPVDNAGRLIRGESEPRGGTFDADLKQAQKSFGGWGRKTFLRVPVYLAQYMQGLATVEERASTHPKYGEMMVVCSRLRENIIRAGWSGDREQLRSERGEIIEVLNSYTDEIFHVYFYPALCQVDESSGAPAGGPSKSPTDQLSIGKWFGSELGPFERCFVVAVALLEGAPSSEISRAAHELNTLELRAQARTGQAQGANEIAGVAPSSAEVTIEDLLASTHTRVVKVEGAERVIWSDEAFGPRVQELIARQATTVGLTYGGRNLLDILQGWAKSENEERAWRAAWSLAQLWWRQDQAQVFRLANEWAKSDDVQTWQSGATLLYGACAAEQKEKPDQASSQSVVLQHLRNWSDWKSNVKLACVACYAYGLLGNDWPEIALDGLDHLLGFDTSASQAQSFRSPPDIVVLFSMFSSLELASAGQIRPMLERFASHAQRFAHDVRHDSTGLLENDKKRAWRERSLDMLFFHVVFLLAFSHSGAKHEGHARYMTQGHLLERPEMPGTRGQDVLLAGVLTQDETRWHSSLQTLFSAAISESRGALAFNALRSWITIVLYEPGAEARAALLRFVRVLAAQLSQWDRELDKSGLRASRAVMEQRLRSWSLASRRDLLPLGQFAQDALRELRD